MDKRIDLLTGEQREVLLRYLRRQEAKEIARDLRISVSAVEQRFQRARAKLGVARTIDAARLVAEYEEACGRPTWGPSRLSDNAVLDEPLPSQSGGATVDAQMEPPTAEPEEPPTEGTRQVGRVFWPLPTRGRETNDLSITSRALWMIFGLVALLVTIALLMNSIVAFNTIFQRHP